MTYMGAAWASPKPVPCPPCSPRSPHRPSFLFLLLGLLPLLVFGLFISLLGVTRKQSTLPAVEKSQRQYLPQQLDAMAWYAAHLGLG